MPHNGACAFSTLLDDFMLLPLVFRPVPFIIEAGDIMLFGNNCLVVFYKSFNSSYSYTKIGHIENLEELEKNNMLIRFEI